jgi:hypothetical protein
MTMPFVPANSARDRIFEQRGSHDTYSGKICAPGEKRFDRHKKEPEKFTLPGFYRLLPQLVGSFDLGGGCRGMGAPLGSAY